jgi:RHS repeat-associated protein
VTNPLGNFVYQYVDETSRVQSLAYPNGQVANLTYYPNAPTDVSGDGDQRLRAIKDLNPNGTNLSSFAYTYDSDGKIVTWGKQPDGGTSYPSILNYDASNQLTSAIVSNPTTQATQGFFYAYDASGNRSSEQIDSSINTLAFNLTNEYVSETAGGLMTFAGTVSEPATVTIGGNAATVDSSNNWLGSAPVTVGSDLIPLTASDSLGNSISKNINVTVSGAPNRTLTYDLNGNLTNNGAGHTYLWDAENRLIEIVQPSGTTGFVYDGAGHKVRETLNGIVIRQWVWCGPELCEERDGSGNVTKRFYAQGEQVAGVPYYFTRDHLGSVREMTDGTGAIRARYDYDPYGRVTKVSGDLSADFGFTGDYYHAATGLSLTMYRAYDPTLGRWLSKDPLGGQGGLNPYEYVNDNPICASDPLGLCDKCRSGVWVGVIHYYTMGFVANFGQFYGTMTCTSDNIVADVVGDIHAAGFFAGFASGDANVSNRAATAIGLVGQAGAIVDVSAGFSFIGVNGGVSISDVKVRPNFDYNLLPQSTVSPSSPNPTGNFKPEIGGGFNMITYNITSAGAN